MNIIITGTNGAVAPFFADECKKHGDTVFAWDRSRISTTDKNEMEQFISECNADIVFHLALGDPAWGAAIAGICFERLTIKSQAPK